MRLPCHRLAPLGILLEIPPRFAVYFALPAHNQNMTGKSPINGEATLTFAIEPPAAPCLEETLAPSSKTPSASLKMMKKHRIRLHPPPLSTQPHETNNVTSRKAISTHRNKGLASRTKPGPSARLHAVGFSGGGIEARKRRANSPLYSSSSSLTRFGSSDLTIKPAWWCFFMR